MMKRDIFSFSNYREYLQTQLESSGSRGRKSALAAVISVQPAYITQVLNEKSHLSLEQAEAANHFLNHNSQESHFFLLMVQKDRAGTESLRTYFQVQLDEILKSRLVVTKRLKHLPEISEEAKGWYYSSWMPAAVHIATTLPNMRTVDTLSTGLQIPSGTLVKILERLEEAGLVQKSGGKYVPGRSEVRLGNSSHHILKHHTSWRLQAISSLENETIRELHYSGVVSLSKKDVLKIKNNLLEMISENLSIVKNSNEEELYTLNIDFFNNIK